MNVLNGMIRTLCKITLIDALYVLSYKQNVISVQAATQKDVSVTFRPEYAKVKVPDGTVFKTSKKGKLY